MTPTPSELPVHRLRLLPVAGTFAVCKLPADSAVPAWAVGGPFVSVTRTADELSIVCLADGVPDAVPADRGWRCLRVAGAMPFALPGVLASLVVPLAAAGIPVFAVSTFDTDYLLVMAGTWDRAVAALGAAGHTVADGG